MPKVPNARKDHRNAIAVAGGDDILVSLAAMEVERKGSLHATILWQHLRQKVGDEAC